MAIEKKRNLIKIEGDYMNTLSKTYIQQHKISKLLAAGLLKKNRQISYTEIATLPTIRNKEDLKEIIDYLLTTFGATQEVIKKDDTPILRWDTVLKIE